LKLEASPFGESALNFQEWQSTVPLIIRSDTVWKVEAYRLALFLSDLSWEDTTKLVRDERTRDCAGQLLRAAGKISAQITEGYSRNTGRERSRWYEYALGSARECRDWYYKGRHVLSESVADHRMELATSIIRLTLTMASHERRTNRKIIHD
jgi:four helix bundle protein